MTFSSGEVEEKWERRAVKKRKLKENGKSKDERWLKERGEKNEKNKR